MPSLPPDDLDALLGVLRELGVEVTAPAPRPTRRGPWKRDGERRAGTRPKLHPLVPTANPPRWLYRIRLGNRVDTVLVADVPPRRKPAAAAIWEATCRACGVTWTTALDPRLPATARARLALHRVPCPVCWALRYQSGNAAERRGLDGVAWLWPRWR